MPNCKTGCFETPPCRGAPLQREPNLRLPADASCPLPRPWHGAGSRAGTRPSDAAPGLPAARGGVNATHSAKSLACQTGRFYCSFSRRSPSRHRIIHHPHAAVNLASPPEPPGQALPPWLCPDSNLRLRVY